MLKRVIWIALVILFSSNVFAITGDFNGDSCVDLDDFFLFAEHYGEILEKKSFFDLNGDRKIDVEDFFIFAENYEKCEENLEIAVATLKKEYKIGEKLELTDPPEDDDSALIQNNKYYVPGELIVKLKKDISNEITGNIIQTGISSFDGLNEKYGVQEIKSVYQLSTLSFSQRAAKLIGVKPEDDDLRRTYKLEFSEKIDVLKIAEEYSRLSSVEYAEPNYLYFTSAVPNDLRYKEQWSHQNTEAEKAWNITTGNESVVIAVVDTGVDYNHEDLAENIWINKGEDINKNGVIDSSDFNGKDDDNNGFIDDLRGYDFVDINTTELKEESSLYSLVDGEDYEGEDNDPFDFNSHGTHVAGIAAAVTNNQKGIAGVCWKCKIMPVRAGFSFEIRGYGNVGSLPDDAIANSIYYAADNGANIISMSFGGGGSNLMEDAIRYASKLGVILVAAAGNERTDFMSYPAAYENVISVAATDKDDRKAEFSNYGYWVDVAAPGVDILSTIPSSNTFTTSRLEVTYYDGLEKYKEETKGFALRYSERPLQNAYGQIIEMDFNKSKDLDWKNLSKNVALIKLTDVSALLELPETVTNLVNGGFTAVILFAEGGIESSDGSIFQEEIKIPIIEITEFEGENWLKLLKKGIKLDVNITISEEKSEEYTEYSGTSMAAPYISGVIGLILSKNINFNQRDVEFILKHSIDTVDSDKYIGYGRINAFKALQIDKIPKIIAEINSPVNGEQIRDSIDIIGTASGNYKVEYGRGIYPKGWIEFGSGNRKRNEILASFDNSNLTDVDYTIKLTVEKENQKAEDYARVKIVNEFQEGWPQVASEREVQGPVTFYDFDGDGFREVLVGSNDGSIYAWDYKGRLLWKYKTNDAVRAAPSIGDVDDDGEEEIVVGSYDGNLYILSSDGGLKLKIPVVKPTRLSPLPPSIKDGKEGAEEINENIRIRGSAVLDDMDNDGVSEIIVGNYGGEVYIFKILREPYYHAEVMNGWPRFVRNSEFEGVYSTPAVEDIDKDGDKDIVIGTTETIQGGQGKTGGKGSIYVFNSHGKIKTGWPKIFVEGGFQPSPILANMDGDDELEIVIGKMGYQGNQGVYVFNNDGSFVDGWPQFTENSAESVAVGDLNKDGSLEVVAGIWQFGGVGKVYVWSNKGKLLKNWPQQTNIGEFQSANPSPILADINGDSNVDIIIAMDSGEIYAWDVSGRRLDGWPKNTGENWMAYFPVVDDIDNDGDIEVGVSSGNKVYIWDLESAYNPSVNEWPMYQNNVRRTGVYIEHVVKESPPSLLPKSQIVNKGNKDIDGRLTITLQKTIYRKGESPIILTVIDEMVTVSKDKPLALDKIFNKQNITIEDFPKGDYYVVATFLTPSNSTYQSSYEFMVV